MNRKKITIKIIHFICFLCIACVFLLPTFFFFDKHSEITEEERNRIKNMEVIINEVDEILEKADRHAHRIEHERKKTIESK